jgi:hypothetical protein
MRNWFCLPPLKIAEFGVEVGGLDGADPDVFGDVDVEAFADGEGKQGIVLS